MDIVKKDKKVYHYKTYNDINKGSYHEECYRTLLDEKFPDDHDNGYEMIVCTNCNEYGESIKDWVAYGHYETECTNCKGKLEIKKFATYEDFLMRNEKPKEKVVKETPKEESNYNEEEPELLQSDYIYCISCGAKSNTTNVNYYDGVHGYFSGGCYCDSCYDRIYADYQQRLYEESLEGPTCYYCGDTAWNRPISFYEENQYVKSGYYHGHCYMTLYNAAENSANEYPNETATVYCPSCGYETGETGQQYLGNHGGSTDCPQCGYTMVEH